MPASRKYNQPQYDGFSTAPEILEAIESINSDSILDMSHIGAYGTWSHPTPSELAIVTQLAFKLADESEDTLCWGCDSIKRPEPKDTTYSLLIVTPDFEDDVVTLAASNDDDAFEEARNFMTGYRTTGKFHHAHLTFSRRADGCKGTLESYSGNVEK